MCDNRSPRVSESNLGESRGGEFPGFRTFPKIFPALPAVAALILALLVPITRYGDASDYVMMTLSLADDGDLVYSESDLRRIENERPPETDFPAGMFLVRGVDGRLFVGGHSFYYSLFAVPFYMLFGIRGFYVLNGLLLSGVLWMVASHFSISMGKKAWLLAFVALCFSASFDYVIWQTPATWLFFLIAGFLFFYWRDRFLVSGLFLGLAAGSQFPLSVWVLLPLIDFVRGRISLSKLLGFGAITLIVILPQVLYFLTIAGSIHITWLSLGTPARYLYFPLQYPGQEEFLRSEHAVAFAKFSRPEHFSFKALATALFAPSMGLIWFYPFSVLAAWRMWKERRGGVALMVALLVLAAYCTAGRLYTHQVGLRYLNPIFPVFLLGFRTFPWKRVEKILLLIVLIMGITFLYFPQTNSAESIRDKAVPAALFHR